MTIDEAKKLLPPELKYPLPDGTIDNLLGIQKIAIDMSEPDEKGMHQVIMAALIELKERREREDKELAERSLEIERDEWEREE
ncbi:hypothetical protein [Selenomonas sp. AE3005]|uniref:hypothetical protein n=1 Tax=Selenomonas sp. AE3005 TaxID=1485543 RepID=UPI0025F6ACD0|nr:hypothetical protein [Selenomonas sp. AE3005]